jgi:hypothetical protein
VLRSLYRHDGWNIGLIDGDARSLIDGTAPPPSWLRLDAGRAFAADPFLIEEHGQLYCFFELLPHATNRGRICYAVVGGGGTAPLPVHDAIVAGHHLSYPSLIRHDGEILCIPEAGESGRVTAYAARSFPDGWYEKHTLIADFPGVDPTVFEHDGRWWMFATNGRAGWNSDLFIFHADTLFGRWQPHAGNPVRRSLDGSRPGGLPFTIDGRLYRPAQDCTVQYGARLIFNEILELSPTHFREVPVAALAPVPQSPYPDGLHTASIAGGRIAVDGNRLHFEPQQALRAIRNRAARLTGRATS